MNNIGQISCTNNEIELDSDADTSANCPPDATLSRPPHLSRDIRCFSGGRLSRHISAVGVRFRILEMALALLQFTNSSTTIHGSGGSGAGVTNLGSSAPGLGFASGSSGVGAPVISPSTVAGSGSVALTGMGGIAPVFDLDPGTTFSSADVASLSGGSAG
ncbi:unnamed protein product [Protopolystoma xenopodis]|uniref:Uncharacterized protein n=1 Tax=Protopolystoma xenopodis TaxID=117903 RepID=A0A3S5BUT7_9PLAT|nr:unnamed protein product [Protopolystoma xenopodis]